jgi:hypothetical protein
VEIHDTFTAAAGFDVVDLERAEIEWHRGDAKVAVPAWLTRIERQ